jgi:hypothetical protein
MPLGTVFLDQAVVGLALSWHLLRRSLALQEVQGNAALATVISTRPTVRGAGPLRVCQQVLNSHASRRAERGMPQEFHLSFRSGPPSSASRRLSCWWTTTTSPSNRMVR